MTARLRFWDECDDPLGLRQILRRQCCPAVPCYAAKPCSLLSPANWTRCLLPCPLLWPVFLPLMPLAPASLAVPAPHHQLSTPYATTITTLCVTNLYCVLHHWTSTQIISSWLHISKDPSTRRSRFTERKATQHICMHSHTSHSALCHMSEILSINFKILHKQTVKVSSALSNKSHQFASSFCLCNILINIIILWDISQTIYWPSNHSRA